MRSARLSGSLLKPRREWGMNIKRKGTGESDAQIIISLINNKLQPANTLCSLLPRSLSSITLCLPISRFTSPSVRPRAISLSDEYSSAALIYSQARVAAQCLFWRCKGEPQEDVFANTLFMIQPKIWSSLVVSQRGPACTETQDCCTLCVSNHFSLPCAPYVSCFWDFKVA